MARASTSLAEGQEVTVLQPGKVTLSYDAQRPAVVFAESFAWADDPSIVILPADARSFLTAALDDAAAFWEPARCPGCATAPEPCGDCQDDEADPAKAQEYRAWAQALKDAAGVPPGTGPVSTER